MTTTSKNTFRPALEVLEDRLTPTVTWHGGPVMTHVVAENLYLGTDWYSHAGGRQMAQYLQGFTSTIVNSPYTDVLGWDGYGVGRGTALAGSYLNYNVPKYVFLTDTQIRACIQDSIHRGWAAQPYSNCLYVVFVEPGVAVMGSDGSTSVPGPNKFGGYHSYFVGTNAYGARATLPYAVIPYPAGINGNPQMYGYKNQADQLTDAASHEIAEAITDPTLRGWYDDRSGVGGEIGDLTVRYHQYLGNYYVQLVANRQGNPVGVANGPHYFVGPYGVVKYGAQALPTPAGQSIAALTAVFENLGSHHHKTGFAGDELAS
jgi:hypothetical protein